MKQQTKNKLFVLFIVLIFIVPMILAKSLFSNEKFRNYLRHKTVNHGQLIQPPLSFTELLSEPNFLSADWTLLYVTPELPCAEICNQQLYKLRQIRLALGKDQNKVSRVLVAIQPIVIPKEYEGTLQKTATKEAIERILLSTSQPQGAIYIVEPKGNIILGYRLDANPKGILNDLQRLLKVQGMQQ